MQDQIYGQMFKLRALERWENEGGRTESLPTGRADASSTDQEMRVINGDQSGGGERTDQRAR